MHDHGYTVNFMTKTFASLGTALLAVSTSLFIAANGAEAFAQEDAPLSGAASTGSLPSAQGSGAGQYTSSDMPFDVRNSTVGNGVEHDNFIQPFFGSLVQPRLAPAGANDWSCKPSAEHPNPVILVHGTLENAYDNRAAMAPALKRDGYCVFAPRGAAGTGWIRRNCAEHQRAGTGSAFRGTDRSDCRRSAQDHRRIEG